MMKEFIKSNKAINFFKSNLIRDTDEIIATARGNINNSIKGINIMTDVFEKRKAQGIPLSEQERSILNTYKSQLNAYKGIEKSNILNHIRTKQDALDLTDDLRDIYFSGLGEGKSFLASKAAGVSDYYFGQGVGKTQKATRLGVTGVGIIGAGIGARYLSGGGMTYNSKGESDIAMVPFI